MKSVGQGPGNVQGKCRASYPYRYDGDADSRITDQAARRILAALPILLFVNFTALRISSGQHLLVIVAAGSWRMGSRMSGLHRFADSVIAEGEILLDFGIGHALKAFGAERTVAEERRELDEG
jgi:hypothetical protein